MALGLTGSRKARVSGLLKKELTIFDTCCNPSLEDMVVVTHNTATQYRAGVTHAQRQGSTVTNDNGAVFIHRGTVCRQKSAVFACFLPLAYPPHP